MRTTPLTKSELEVAADLTRDLQHARTPIELEYVIDLDEDLWNRHMLLTLWMDEV